jgi:hypothetical protein
MGNEKVFKSIFSNSATHVRQVDVAMAGRGAGVEDTSNLACRRDFVWLVKLVVKKWLFVIWDIIHFDLYYIFRNFLHGTRVLEIEMETSVDLKCTK